MLWLPFLLLLVGLVVLIYGADLIVKGASRLALILGMSPLIIGLTIVAFGTSAPELAISAMSSISGKGDLAFGNVIGSNICNTLLILGLSAMIAPLVVHQKLIRFDVPLMIGISILVGLLVYDGNLSQWEGALLATGLLAYLIFVFWESKNETPTVQKEYDNEFGKTEQAAPKKLLWNILLLIAGLSLLVTGSRMMVSGAVDIASFFGVSELIIGLTIVALGTSLPEVATSIIAAFKKEQDIAVGNVIGSNLFNLMGVLGVAGILSPSGIQISQGAVAFDVPFMIGTAVACLPIFFTGFRISRWEGLVFLLYYIAYLTYLALQTSEHEFLTLFDHVLLSYVVPLTFLTLGVIAFRHLQLKRSK